MQGDRIRRNERLTYAKVSPARPRSLAANELQSAGNKTTHTHTQLHLYGLTKPAVTSYRNSGCMLYCDLITKHHEQIEDPIDQPWKNERQQLHEQKHSLLLVLPGSLNNERVDFVRLASIDRVFLSA